MRRSVKLYGVVALGALIGLVSTAEAQTAHGRHRHPAAEGREIVVHARESWLTAGTNAPVGSRNGYVLSTFGGGPTTFTPFVDNTTVGVQGLDRMPSNFTVPGCCVP